MTNEEVIARADRARRILESDEWKSAWDAYKSVLIDTIESTPDDQVALTARRMLVAARQARSHLELLITDGRVAASDISAIKSRLRLA